MQSLLSVAGYGALATIAMNVGGLVAAYWPPNAKARSYMQHVAAGFVFAAAAVEVLPDVIHRDRAVPAALGFAAGLALTLAIRVASEKFGESGGNGSFIGTLIADLLIDGPLSGEVNARARQESRHTSPVVMPPWRW